MIFDRPDSTSIHTLRVVGGARDALALQLDMQRALAQSRLAPAGLPDTAILCVRRVRAAIPRQAGQASQGELARAALQAALDELARGAARPARGAVPAQAAAVVFADRAELLACLACDWCAGRVAERWWWRDLFRGGDIGAAVVGAWLDTPEYAPAAIEQLAARGEAARFVQSLEAGASRALLRALLERFALHALRPLLDTARQLGRSAPTGSRPAGGPWLGWAPESGADGLRPEQQALLGVGLMLQRAPAPLRAPTFARAVEEWLDTGDSAPAPHARPAASPPAAPEALTAPQAGAPAAALPRDTRPALAPRSRVEQPATGAAPTAASAPAPADAAPMPLFQEAVIEEATAASPAPALVPEPLPGAGTRALEQVAPLLDRPLVEARIDTAFGGLFYLLNLALALELYGDFTMPAHPGIALPIWDFLALAGLDLLRRPLRVDPVWALLAHLAGRPPERAPGHDFVPPGDWRVPLAWLAPFPGPAALRWSVSGDRVRVQHPAGFPVLDIARTGDPRQLSAELGAYGPDLPCLPDGLPPPDEPATALDRWLRCLMAYVRARLRRALGRSDGEIAGLVCAHQATVYVSTARLDIVLSLAELPIAIRLAGLDRDPGWIPAAGRSVAFHFD